VTQDAVWTEEMSEVYDRCLGPVIFEPYAQRLAQLARELAPDRVLEIAAGSGIVTRALTAALPSAEVTATDLNEGMVVFGSRRAPSATWRSADAQQLPFPDGSFDLVVCQFGVMFFPDKVTAFREMARVLRPGGTALLAIWDVVEATDFATALVHALSEHFPEDTPDFIVRIPHGYVDTDTIRADIGAGGLEVTALERVVEDTHAPSALSMAEGYCKGSPLTFALAQRGDVDALTGAVGRSMTTSLGEGPITGQMAAFVVTARKS
jgi:SAM-dependent methyltransferase